MAGSTATNNSHHTPDLVLVGIVGGGLLGIFCIMGLIAFCLRRLMPARDFLPDSAPQSPGSEGPNTRITISAPGPMDSSRFSAFSGRSSLDFASTSGSSRRLGFDCSKEDHLGSMRGVIEGIPELDYADLVKIKDKKLVDSDSCAVCLAEFEEHEFKIRVLPRCGHCFHSECIDLWLYSRTSCPLCRQSLLVPPIPAPPASDPSAIAANPPDVPERVDLPQTEPISTDQNPDR